MGENALLRQMVLPMTHGRKKRPRLPLGSGSTALRSIAGREGRAEGLAHGEAMPRLFESSAGFSSFRQVCFFVFGRAIPEHRRRAALRSKG